MYQLCVINPGHDKPLTIRLQRPSEVLEMIPRLVADHPDCDRIEVYGVNGLLFSVDCAGVTPAKPHKDMSL
jgi:hypothetical protein